jgi:malonyl CoA-acyl carrier protein transacylase
MKREHAAINERHKQIEKHTDEMAEAKRELEEFKRQAEIAIEAKEVAEWALRNHKDAELKDNLDEILVNPAVLKASHKRFCKTMGYDSPVYDSSDDEESKDTKNTTE